MEEEPGISKNNIKANRTTISCMNECMLIERQYREQRIRKNGK